MIEETVKIVNPKQASLYMKNGLQPIRVYWNIDRIVSEFSRDESYPLYEKWCNYELK